MAHKLQCTYAEWNALAVALDKTKGATVKVPTEALDKLMKDHSHFIQYHRRDLTGDT